LRSRTDENVWKPSVVRHLQVTLIKNDLQSACTAMASRYSVGRTPRMMQQQATLQDSALADSVDAHRM